MALHLVAGWLQRDLNRPSSLLNNSEILKLNLSPLDQDLLSYSNVLSLPIRQVPTRNFNQRPQHEISLVVIHCIALPPHSYGGPYIDQLFTLSLNKDEHPYFENIYNLELSTHLFINRQGQITQYVSFLDRAYHAGRSSYLGQIECNDYGIGIELEGSDDDVYTNEQYLALNEVLLTLYKAYPSIQNRIASHSEIAPQRKTDPGIYFDYDKLIIRRHLPVTV